MTKAQSEILLRRKKLLWRAMHRGMKEMDLMLGRYGEQHLDQMDKQQLDEFEALLEVSDAYLIDWLTDKSETPDQYKTTMFAAIKAQSFVTSDYKEH